jgi:hypothetical protein
MIGERPYSLTRCLIISSLDTVCGETRGEVCNSIRPPRASGCDWLTETISSIAELETQGWRKLRCGLRYPYRSTN